MGNKKIIVIVGPTGVGKTKLSIMLAKELDGEIINADSMQFYKDLNIGTAKIKEEEKEGVLSRNKTPILVGGSGLYIRAALYDYKLQDEDSNNMFDELSNEELLKRCLEYDKDCDIHLNNRKRLIRFLNKHLNNSIFEKDSKKLYDFTMIGLTTNRSNLYNIINKRVDKMIEEGLVKEVKEFYDKKIRSKAIMTGIGYKELYSYFDNEISLEEAIELIKKNSRHLAKRQYTFFNNQFTDIKWIETDYDNFNNTVVEASSYIRE